jgi:hypothetical protein
VTTFDGPMAEQRARDYFDALKREAEEDWGKERWR